MTSIKSLKDKNGDSFFPVTHINAIFDSDGERGELVQAKEIVDVIDFNLEDSIINKVNNIENDLNKTENTKYATENGVKEFSCKDGYIDNVVIEGETLVNLFSFKKTESSSDNSVWVHINTDYISLFKEIEYTLINTSNKTIFVDIYSNDTNSYKRNLLIKANSSIKDTLASNEHYSKCTGFFSDSWSLSDLSVISSTLVILEGNHTNKSISYFEGLKSVGQGDKIEVMTYSDDIEVIYEESNVSITNNTDKDTWFNKNGVLINSTSIDPSLYDVEITESGWYTLQNIDIDENVMIVQFLNSDYTTYASKNRYVYLYKGNYVMRYKIPKGSTGIIRNVSLVKIGKLEKKYAYTTLRSLPNGVKDTIEKRGNKYVKVQRCGEVTLNGSEDWTNVDYGITSNLSMRFDLNYQGIFLGKSCSIADKLSTYNPLISDETNGRNFYIANHIDHSRFIIVVPKDLLSAQNLSGFKAWLQANPVTVVYQLATPQIIELPNFNPQIYEGDTTLVLNTGVIQCECEFEVTNSIGSEIEVLKDKVSCLDDYESGYEYSNEIMYLNGTYKLSWAEDPYIVRIGKICILHCIVANDAITYGMPLLKLPNFAKPKQYHRFFGRGKNDGIPTLLIMDYDINPDGLLYFYESSNGQIQQLNQLYIHAIWEVE